MPDHPHRNTAVRTIIRGIGKPMRFAKAQEDCEDNGITLGEAEYVEVYLGLFPDDKEAKARFLDLERAGAYDEDPEEETQLEPRPAFQQPLVGTPPQDQPQQPLSNVQMSEKVKEILKLIGPGKTYRQALPEFESRGIKPSPAAYARNYKLVFGGGKPRETNAPAPKEKVKRQYRSAKEAMAAPEPGPVPAPVLADSLAAQGLEGLKRAKQWAGGWSQLKELICVLEQMS